MVPVFGQEKDFILRLSLFKREKVGKIGNNMKRRENKRKSIFRFFSWNGKKKAFTNLMIFTGNVVKFDTIFRNYNVPKITTSKTIQKLHR